MINKDGKNMKCNIEDCNGKAITFHGVTMKTHGYCEKHRHCSKCGLMIND